MLSRLEKQIPCEDDRKKSKGKGSFGGSPVVPSEAQRKYPFG